MHSVASLAGIASNDRRTAMLAVALAVAAYLSMYADGAVHAASLGPASGAFAYLHEFFHHARHLGFACH